MTVTELKAKAYDVMAQMQQLQQELIRINNEIAALSQKTTHEEFNSSD